MLGKALERGTIEMRVADLRDWADNRWKQVDDEPYGGGAGMVIQAPPVVAAVRELRQAAGGSARTIFPTPRGRKLDQGLAEELSLESNIIVVCGRYEGFDERVYEILEPDEISMGDFILGGGEVAAMALVEVVSRLIPGVVGDPDSVAEDSFSSRPARLSLLHTAGDRRGPVGPGCSSFGQSRRGSALAHRTGGGGDGNPTARSRKTELGTVSGRSPKDYRYRLV